MMSPGVTRPVLAPLRSHLSALRRGILMATERLAMRHVRDVIRLKSAGMPTREIARRVGTAPSTVRLTIRRFEAAGLTWPLPDDVTDAVLEARLFAGVGAGPGIRRGHRRQAEPDWAAVHRELRRKHVTLSILWEEYIAGEPGGYRYSRFCELYRAWEGRLSVTMRQSHAAGDKLFVDYAGDGVPVVIDRRTARRADLRRGTRRIQLHLRTGDLDAGARRLDQRPRRRLRGDRRRAGAAGAGQHQGRGDQGLPLRSADQPQLRRHGGALRHRHSAGQATTATGQGEGRAGGPHGRALAARAP